MTLGAFLHLWEPLSLCQRNVGTVMLHKMGAEMKGLHVNKAPGLMPWHVGLFLPNILQVGKSKFTDKLVTFWAWGEVLMACHG